MSLCRPRALGRDIGVSNAEGLSVGMTGFKQRSRMAVHNYDLKLSFWRLCHSKREQYETLTMSKEGSRVPDLKEEVYSKELTQENEKQKKKQAEHVGGCLCQQQILGYELSVVSVVVADLAEFML